MIRVNASSVRADQSQVTMCRRVDVGALGRSADGSVPVAPGVRNQYRVTIPKLPPPPPVWAHHSSRLGSSAALVATTLRAWPEASTTTTSTAYRWSATTPSRRDSGP